MAEPIKFTELTNAGELSLSAIMAIVQQQAGELVSLQCSMAQVAELVASGATYQELTTEQKTLISAINEIAAGGGGGGGAYFFAEGQATAAQIRERYNSGLMCFLIANDDTIYPLTAVDAEYIQGERVEGVFFAKAFGYGDNINVNVKYIQNSAGVEVSSVGFTGIANSRITSDMSTTNGKIPTDDAVRAYVTEYIRTRLEQKLDLDLNNISAAGEQKIRDIAGGGGGGDVTKAYVDEQNALQDAEITKNKDSLTELNEDIYSVTPAGEEWSILDGTSESGWIHKNTHATQDASNPNTEHIIYTDIVGGDTYRYSSNGGGNCCAVLWLDSSDNYISFVDFTVTFRYETVEVIAPTNATKAIVNAMDKTKGTTRFEHYASTGEIKTVKLADKGDVNLYEESRKSLIINSQLSNDYAWKVPNKLYVSFVFDDTNRDIDLIEELFRSKNVPVCFATVPSRLDNVCTNGEKARTVLLRAQANGGEILSHWDSPLTSESTDEDYYNVIVGSKRTLVNAGFNVNGLIVAGGTNYDTQDFVKDIEIARPYYKYSDLIANGHVDVEQFYNLRQFLTTNTATNRSYIDTFIANGEIANHGKKGWIIFASHGANDSVTIPIISDLLDYIASKGTDVIEVVNCNTAYEKGRTSKIAKEYANEVFVANSDTFSTPLKFIKSGKFVSINMRDVPFSVTVPTGWKTSGIMPTLPSNFMPTENINVQLTTNAGQYGTIVINSAGQATLYTSTEKTSGSNTNIVGSWVAK